MLLKVLRKFAIFGLSAVLISCSTNNKPLSTNTNSNSTPTSNSGSKAIVIADVSNNPAKKIKRYQPMADYLATNLNEFGIKTGEVKVVSDISEISSGLKSGKIDVYFDSLYPAMIVSDETGGQIVLRRWKRKDPEYYTIIFTMKDNGIDSVKDLQGKVVAFDDPRSTSGYMMPMAYLIKAKLKPVVQDDASTKVKSGQIGYIFSKDDENTIQWVISGKVKAGAVDNQTFEGIPETTRSKMKILAETEKIPRQVVLIRKEIDSRERETIKKIFLEMDKTPEGKKVLEEFEKTLKFDDVPTGKYIEKIRQTYQLVKNR